MTAVGLTGYGRYVPDEVVTGEEIAAESGIPEEVVVEKMGMREKRVCPPDADHCTEMGRKAAEDAIADADVDPGGLDMVLYHGSEYKDYVVWSAAAKLCDDLGATNAFGTESYTLCAGCPIAMRQVRGMLDSGDLESVLLVASTREEDLVDYGDEESSFMFNFGSGAAAYVLEADPASVRTRARVHRSHAVTDGSFSEDVLMPAGGSRHPPSAETLDEDMHHLTVPDPDGMKERLAPVSLPNYLEVADVALQRSGFDRGALDFVAATHMKRSFHETLLEELEVDPYEDGYYLDEYGHMQSADQIVALDEARQAGNLDDGDVVLFLAAGTGYTWSATVLEWLG